MIQDATANDITTLQKERSLIERTFQRLKQWSVLGEFQIDSFGKETVENHVQKMEDVVDAAVALANLALFGKGKRLDSIPPRDPRGADFRYLTDPARVPLLRLPKTLYEDDLRRLPHISDFLESCTTFSPIIQNSLFEKIGGGAEDLCTKNVFDRGENLFASGYVSKLKVARSRDNNDVWLVTADVFPSMKAGVYLVGLQMILDNPLYKWRCSCTNG